MNWGILGALEAEVALIRSKMEVEREAHAYGTTFTQGSIGGQKLTVVCASIGTINAAACTAALIREFGATAVVNCGIAGAMAKQLRIMDVVLSSDVVFHDADAEIFQKYYPYTTGFSADEKLIALAGEAIGDIPDRPFSHYVGRVATGDIFVNDPRDKRRIAEGYHPMCVEMEGAAVGQVAYMNDTPFLVIRTMSDNADENADESYDNFLEDAAVISSRIVLNMIARG